MAETLAGRSDLPRAKLPVPQLAEEGYFAKVVSGAWQAMPADPEGVTAAGAAAADEIGNATGATTQEKLWTFFSASDFRKHLEMLHLIVSNEGGYEKLALGIGGISLFAESGKQHRIPYTDSTIPFTTSAGTETTIACIA